MKKILLLIIGALLMIQLPSFSQTKLKKKQPVKQDESPCDRLTPQIKETNGLYTVTLKSKLVDEWVMLAETNKDEPIFPKRNTVKITQVGKYKLLAKANDNLCSININISNSASRGLISYFGSRCMLYSARSNYSWTWYCC